MKLTKEFNKLTKKEKENFKQLIDLYVEFGYWSKEVSDFNSLLDHKTMTNINNAVLALEYEWMKKLVD